MEKFDIPLILATIKIMRKAYNMTMNRLLLRLEKKHYKIPPVTALKQRIIQANAEFERLEQTLEYIDDGIEEY